MGAACSRQRREQQRLRRQQLQQLAEAQRQQQQQNEVQLRQLQEAGIVISTDAALGIGNITPSQQRRRGSSMLLPADALHALAHSAATGGGAVVERNSAPGATNATAGTATTSISMGISSTMRRRSSLEETVGAAVAAVEEVCGRGCMLVATNDAVVDEMLEQRRPRSFLDDESDDDDDDDNDAGDEYSGAYPRAHESHDVTQGTMMNSGDTGAMQIDQEEEEENNEMMLHPFEDATSDSDVGEFDNKEGSTLADDDDDAAVVVAQPHQLHPANLQRRRTSSIKTSMKTKKNVPSLLRITNVSIADSLKQSPKSGGKCAVLGRLDALNHNCQQAVFDILASRDGEVTPSALRAFGEGALSEISLRGAAVAIQDNEWDAALARQSRVLDFSAVRCESLQRFTFLQHLRMLRTLDLSFTPIVDEELKGLAHTSSLRKLTLRGCYELSGSGLGHVNATNLEVLDLQECQKLGKGQMRGLWKLNRLRCLELGWCRGVKDADIACLRGPSTAAAQSLESLDLSGTLVSGTGLKHIAHLSALRELTLSACRNIDDDGLEKTVTSLSELQSLDLNWCAQITCGWMVLLGRNLKQLKELLCNGTSVNDRVIRVLPRVAPKLNVLSLNSCPLTDAGIASLGLLNRLSSISLEDTAVGNEGLVALSGCPLEHLNINHARHVTDSGIARFAARCKGLQSLEADTRCITDDGMEAIGMLTRLHRLDLFGAQVSDNGVKHLQALAALEHLELCSGMLSDIACGVIGDSMLKLEHLNLSNNDNISDKGLAKFHQLRELNALNLTHSRVSHGGVERLLKKVSKLKTLVLYECPLVSRSGIESIQVASGRVFVKV